MSDTVSPIEFGRVLGHLEGIRSELTDLKTRTVWRLDNIESRVEALESHRTVAERPRLADTMADKILWGILGAMGVGVLKLLGVL